MTPPRGIQIYQGTYAYEEACEETYCVSSHCMILK